MSPHRIRAAACAALALFAAACADELPTDAPATADDARPGASTLAATHLGVYNGTAYDINNHGVMVGSAHEDGGPRGIVWSPTSGLDTLAGLDPARGYPWETPFGINDLGQIVGVSLPPEGRFRAVLWTSAGAQPIDLGTSTPTRESQAQDINRGGMIVGRVQTEGRLTHAVVWTPDRVMHDIDPTGEHSGTAAVNDSGKVVGFKRVAGRTRAFLWTQPGGTVLLPVGGDSSTAVDINTRGDVVGSIWFGQEQRGYVWSPRTGLTVLGTFGGYRSYANAISDAGTVLGAATDAFGNRINFLWTLRSGIRRLLPEGDWRRAAAYAINRQGHVAGSLEDSQGYPQMTRWIVTEVNSAPSVSLPPAFTAHEGDTLTLAVPVSDAEGDPLSYYWSFGDGTHLSVPAGTGPASVRRTWNDDGTYTLRVIAIDPSGARDTATSTVVVYNRLPTATFTAPAYTYEGRTYVLAAAALKDGPADLRAGIQVAFDCGAGYSAWALATRVTCPAKVDDDSVEIGVRLRDNDGAVTEYRRPFVIYNAQPVVTASAVTSTSTAVGGSFTARGSFSDPGAMDGPWLVRYYWGDGTYSPTTVTTRGTLPAMSHVYRAAGSYPVTVYVTDKDGRNGKSTPLTVTVGP